jgi:adenylate cyclase
VERVNLKRRLTAVLLADVVGYSRLMSIDEESTHIRLSDHVRDLIQPTVAEYGGRLIRSMGDGLLIEFDSAVDAVRCAVDIQRGLVERNAGVAAQHQIKLRIGINTGDVIVDERDIYGNSVNIAARLEGLAEPGDIYVTRAVRDQLRGYPALVFEDKGERPVKNIDRPIRVFRVQSAPAPGPSLPPASAVFGGLDRVRRAFSVMRIPGIVISAILVATAGLVVSNSPFWRGGPRVAEASIIILPFANLSSDAGQDYFADAVTDDLTTDLSRLPNAFVIARATAFTYKGKAVDARQIGQECAVRYLLEGSIKRSGTRVQTNARLVDTSTARQIWADRFDYEIVDLFELQEVITGRIAAALDTQLIRAESRRLSVEHATNPEAVDLRLQAMGLYISGITPEHTLAGRRLLQESVRLDPRSAEAWAWLADLLASDYLNVWNDAGRDQLKEAELAAQQALSIDQNLALAHFARGLVHRGNGEHQAALDAFSAALKLNPSFARAYAQKGAQLVNLGQPDAAPPLVEKAIALSPRDSSLGTFYWIIGRAHFFAGRYHDAIPRLRKSVEMRPNLWYNRLYLVSAYALVDDIDEAAKILSEFNSDRKFSGYTLKRVIESEEANPNNNPVIVSGRENFHRGLLKAGMAP